MQTKIEWTTTTLPNGDIHPGYTFNPWWGCMKVSPGCKNCYAEKQSNHYHGPQYWGPDSQRKGQSDKYWKDPYKWDAKAKQLGISLKVFCASMADVFEGTDTASDEAYKFMQQERTRLLTLIYNTPHLDWLLLTKRPENFFTIMNEIIDLIVDDNIKKWLQEWKDGTKYPVNVWLGTTVEDKSTLIRVIYLKALPAKIRFLSMEPMLGPVDIRRHCLEDYDCVIYPHDGSRVMKEAPIYDADCTLHDANAKIRKIHWIIAGGESGDKSARPLHPDWIRSIRDQAAEIGIPFFFKQWGEYYTDSFIGTGEPYFRMFENKQQWINKADTWVQGGKCISMDGRHLTKGEDFDNCEYPVAIMDYVGKRNAGNKIDGMEIKGQPKSRLF